MIHIVYQAVVGHHEAMRLMATHRWYCVRIPHATQWGCNILRIFN